MRWTSRENDWACFKVNTKMGGGDDYKNTVRWITNQLCHVSLDWVDQLSDVDI